MPMPDGNGGLTSQILTKTPADTHGNSAFIKEDIAHIGGSNMDNNLAQGNQL